MDITFIYRVYAGSFEVLQVEVWEIILWLMCVSSVADTVFVPLTIDTVQADQLWLWSNCMVAGGVHLWSM